MKCDSVYIFATVRLAGIMGVAMLLIVAAIPLQIGWSEKDIHLCYAVAAIAVMGIAICVLTKRHLKFVLTDCLVALLYAYFMARYYMDATYPAEGMAIHATIVLAMYLSLRLLMSGALLSGNTLAMMILVYAAYEAMYGVVQLLAGSSRHYLYPVTGSFNNPGPYSASLVAGLVLICIYLKSPGRFMCCDVPKKMQSAIFMAKQCLAILFASLIIITMSRTAIIASVLCLFIIFWHDMSRWRWLVSAICAGLCACMYFFKSGSADGRVTINVIGMHAVADSPWLGSGTGSFFHKFARTTEGFVLSGMDLNTVDVIEYAFNDWLRVAVELGAVGLTVASAIMVITLCVLWRESKPLFLSLLIIMVFALLSYPMSLLPYRILTIILVSFAASATRPISMHPNVVLRCLLALVIVCCVMIKSGRVKALVSAENSYNMMRGIDEAALIDDYASIMPLLDDNKRFLFDYAKLLAEQGRYNDSNAMLRLGSLLTNDPMMLVLQGNNYRDMGMVDEAEEIYLRAWHTMPNRIYPLYRLMTLHLQEGNATKATEYARRVADFKEKVSSPAVREMKREAREVIGNSE